MLSFEKLGEYLRKRRSGLNEPTTMFTNSCQTFTSRRTLDKTVNRVRLMLAVMDIQEMHASYAGWSERTRTMSLNATHRLVA